jgi:classical protein kinase C alpha type
LGFFQKNRLDVGNFDKEFTNDPPELTPMTKEQKFFIMNLDQTEFQGFSFLNPEYLQHV